MKIFKLLCYNSLSSGETSLHTNFLETVGGYTKEGQDEKRTRRDERNNVGHRPLLVGWEDIKVPLA